MERICRYICLLCVCFMVLQVQANRRKVMECPGFVLSNTTEIEFKRIIQTSEQTQVDAVMYAKPGTPVVISSKAAAKMPIKNTRINNYLQAFTQFFHINSDDR